MHVVHASRILLPVAIVAVFEFATRADVPGPFAVGAGDKPPAVAADLASVTNRWQGAVSADWHAPGNWSAGHVPAAGEAALVDTGADIVLTNTTDSLAAFVMHGGRVVFSNWTTCLIADEVELHDGVIGLPPAFTPASMSNRVWIVSHGGFTLHQPAQIDVRGCGYGAQHGTGAGLLGSNRSGGGGHGGRGGRGETQTSTGGAVYGSVSHPGAPGSGGGSYNINGGGSGGGVVWIEAAGNVRVDGAIRATGQDAQVNHGDGPGSGGSILIVCNRFDGGGSGLLDAAGGNALLTSSVYWSGGGGGGRIAVHYAEWAETCAIRFAAPAGAGWSQKPSNKLAWEHMERHAARDGTVFLSDTAILGDVLANRLTGVNLHFGSVVDWRPASLTVTNCSATLADSDLDVTVAGNILLGTGCTLGLSGNLTTLGGDLILTNGAVLSMVAARSNAAPDECASRVGITGDVHVATSSWIRPYAHESGGSTLFEMRNLHIAPSAGFNAVASGLGAECGEGRGLSNGNRAGGGGHGGRGQRGETSTALPGGTYGVLDAPIAPGSGGGLLNSGAMGGGVVRIKANAVRHNGEIRADGGAGADTVSGGGSGGSIYLRCAVLGGDGGLFSVRGGNANTAYVYSGGGGGGRVALDYAALDDMHRLRFDAAGGANKNNLDWTNFWWRCAQNGTVHLKGPPLLRETLDQELFNEVDLYVDGLSEWHTDRLSVSNCSVTFCMQPFELVATNALRVGANGRLGVRGSISLPAGDLVVTNGGRLTVYAGATNGVGHAYGALIRVAGDIIVGPGSWIHPRSHETNGGSPCFVTRHLSVAAGGGFDAVAGGMALNAGLGAGKSGSSRAGGGAFGGRGGRARDAAVDGGLPFGSATAPLSPGCAGGEAALDAGGRGGGVVWIEANRVALGGELRADGANGWTAQGGGGSGGGVFIVSHALEAAASAVVQANGGHGGLQSATYFSGAGGGGRIAIWRARNGLRAADRQVLFAGGVPRSAIIALDSDPPFPGLLSAAKGTGPDSQVAVYGAEPGSILFGDLPPPPGTLFFVR